MRILAFIVIFAVCISVTDAQTKNFIFDKSHEYALKLQEELGLSEERMCEVQMIIEDEMRAILKEEKIRNYNQFLETFEARTMSKIKVILQPDEVIQLDSFTVELRRQRTKLKERRKLRMEQRKAKRKRNKTNNKEN